MPTIAAKIPPFVRGFIDAGPVFSIFEVSIKQWSEDETGAKATGA